MNKLFELLSFLLDTQETEETTKLNKLTIMQAVIFRALLLRVMNRRKKSCYTVTEKYRKLFHLQLCWFNSFDTNYFTTTYYYTLSNT